MALVKGGCPVAVDTAMCKAQLFCCLVEQAIDGADELSRLNGYVVLTAQSNPIRERGFNVGREHTSATGLGASVDLGRPRLQSREIGLRP